MFTAIITTAIVVSAIWGLVNELRGDNRYDLSEILEHGKLYNQEEWDTFQVVRRKTYFKFYGDKEEDAIRVDLSRRGLKRLREYKSEEVLKRGL